MFTFEPLLFHLGQGGLQQVPQASVICTDQQEKKSTFLLKKNQLKKKKIKLYFTLLFKGDLFLKLFNKVQY